ncbi:hypothetical protein L6452_02452 [Arctium lappa]|uniref:Uncharacterized protein n=1 Tax=Arctium lappa TaxID=4217 RepID=A0ACB9FJY8_ARCLA|nr:hypothetical protein L6452_02452 [Arctium lappa]
MYITEEIELTFLNVEVGGVPDTIEILLDCEAKGHELSEQRPPSIYMVPRILPDLSPRSFEPRVVSIGPLHRENKTLQEIEAQKATYLHHLLKRLSDQPRKILDACLQRVNASIPAIRACYSGMMTYTDAELAKMMVIDACFILEFLFPSEEHGFLIFRNVSLTHSISSDLVLLENQIPFFVLQDIFDCTLLKLPTIPSLCLTSNVLERLQFLNPFEVNETYVVHTTPPPPPHILGLLQTSFHPTVNTENPSICPSSPMHSHSAIELDQVGVKFKPNEDGEWSMSIDFSSSWFACFFWCCGNSTLKMPVMHIYDNTEIFLRNIIAYEQCTQGVPNYVTSYACAIDYLVDTTEDVSMLVKSKVLTNHLGSNEDATNMINNIVKGVTFMEFYYLAQWKQLDGFYNGCWPKNIAWLKRTYFNSPWNAIALLAGIVLFALTIIQTIYAIKAK